MEKHDKVDVHIRADTNETPKSEETHVQQFDQLFDYDIITPRFSRKLGNCRAFWYKRGSPIITIGPDCNIVNREILCHLFDNRYYSISILFGVYFC